MRYVNRLFLIALACGLGGLTGCGIFKASGDAVSSVGTGAGHAVEGIGEGAGTAVRGTGRAIRSGAEATQREMN